MLNIIKYDSFILSNLFIPYNLIYPDIKYKSINIGNWDNGYVSIAVYASALYIIVKGITRNINNLIINFM